MFDMSQLATGGPIKVAKHERPDQTGWLVTQDNTPLYFTTDREVAEEVAMDLAGLGSSIASLADVDLRLGELSVA